MALLRECPQCCHVLGQLVDELRPARQGGGGRVREVRLHIATTATGIEPVPKLIAPEPVQSWRMLADVAPLLDRNVPEVQVSLLCVSRGIFHVRNDVVDPCLRRESGHGVSQAIGISETLEERLGVGFARLHGQHLLVVDGHVCDRKI